MCIRDRHKTDKLGMTALMRAWRRSQKEEVIILLLSHGAKVFDFVHHRPWWEELILQNYPRTHDMKIMKLFLENKGNINVKTKAGNSALIESVRRNNLEAIDLCIQYGADLDYQNYHGTTALMEAVRDARLEIVNSLLAHGADPNAKNKQGETALMMLPRRKDAATFLDVLLKAGADIHVRDNKGLTPLMWACSGHQFEVMNKLISLGLNPHELDEKGYNRCEPLLKPLSFAQTFDERDSCEGSPTDEVVALAKAIRRLGHELKDLNLKFDENALDVIAAGDGLRYLVGP